MLPLRDGKDAGGWEWRRECSVSERHDEHRRQAIDQVAGKGHVRLDFDSPPFGGRDSKDLLEGRVLVFRERCLNASGHWRAERRQRLDCLAIVVYEAKAPQPGSNGTVRALMRYGGLLR